MEQRLLDRLNTPEFKALMRIEEPYQYRDRLTMPKLILNASGDQFFLPDSSQFYFDGLRGEKHLRYVPNADHSLGEVGRAREHSRLLCRDRVGHAEAGASTGVRA